MDRSEELFSSLLRQLPRGGDKAGDLTLEGPSSDWQRGMDRAAQLGTAFGTRLPPPKDDRTLALLLAMGRAGNTLEKNAPLLWETAPGRMAQAVGRFASGGTPYAGPGLRREDYTDDPEAPQPHEPMINDAMNVVDLLSLGGMPMATRGAVGAFGGRPGRTLTKADELAEAGVLNEAGAAPTRITVPVGRKMRDVAEPETYTPPGIGHNRPPPDVTGSLNPLDNVPVTFNGKSPAQMTPAEITAWGEHYGVPDLGKLSPPQAFKDMQGNTFNIPGGLEGKWTHADLLSMKANPINPANIDRGLHIEMQKKLGRTMTPEALSDADVWNGLVFGMTSPNNPLFPNQMAASRLRLRTPEMLDDLASMIPWKAGEAPSAAARKLVSDQIAQRFGLNAAPQGLGVRGTTDYSRLGELAQMFKEKPEFFRKRPDEDWLQAVERISSQVPGLSMKTGSFGTVWQDPATAGISAIDRHMARELDKQPGGIFASPVERTKWENQSVGRWNKRETGRVAEEMAVNKKLKPQDRNDIAPPDLAADFSDLMSKRGSDKFMGEMLLDHVGAALEPQFRYATGKVNPNLPPHLAQADWVREPQNVLRAGRAYKQALEVNQKIANESGLPLFMSQWMEWDRIRNRFEPHENMFPGLSKLPAQSVDQLRAVNVAHKQTGHKTYGKSEEGLLEPTRPYPGNMFQMGLYGAGGAAVLPQLMPRGQGEEK